MPGALRKSIKIRAHTSRPFSFAHTNAKFPGILARRIRRELTRRSFNHPLILWRFEFEYVGSGFGILTPRRIVWSYYDRGRTGADKQPELLLGGKVVFEYGGFRRFDVNSPDATLNPPAKP